MPSNETASCCAPVAVRDNGASLEPVATTKLDEDLGLRDLAQLLPFIVADLPGRTRMELAMTTIEARLSTASEDAGYTAIEAVINRYQHVLGHAISRKAFSWARSKTICAKK